MLYGNVMVLSVSPELAELKFTAIRGSIEHRVRENMADSEEQLNVLFATRQLLIPDGLCDGDGCTLWPYENFEDGKIMQGAVYPHVHCGWKATD